MSKEDKEHEETMRNAMNLIKESEDLRQGKSAKTEPKEAPKAPAKKGFWSKLGSLIKKGFKKLFGKSSSSEQKATEAHKPAPAASRAESHGKAQEHSQAQSEDLSKIREAVVASTKKFESLKHKITGQPLTDKDREKFKQDIKAIQTMNKEQLSAKSQELNLGIEKATRGIEGIAKAKETQATAQHIQANVQNAIKTGLSNIAHSKEKLDEKRQALNNKNKSR